MTCALWEAVKCFKISMCSCRNVHYHFINVLDCVHLAE